MRFHQITLIDFHFRSRQPYYLGNWHEYDVLIIIKGSVLSRVGCVQGDNVRHYNITAGYKALHSD